MANEASAQAPGARLVGAAQEGPDAEHAEWISAISRIGQAGLVLNRSLDALKPEELSRMLNLFHTGDGRLTSRLGQTLFATSTGVEIHSIARLNDPKNNTFTYIWGGDTAIGRGTGGGLNPVDAGYSGSPLTMIPHRPILSSAPWMIVADSTKMSIVPMSGAVLPLGLAAPSAVAVPAVQAPLTKSIIKFNASDTTGSGSWFPTAGQDRSSPVVPTGDAGTKEDTPIDPTNFGVNGVGFRTNPGAAKTGYSTWWGTPLPNIDLTTFGGGIAATDDDIIHVWMQVNHGAILEEVRIYLICSDTFDPAVLPGSGTIPVGGTAAPNKDAFVKAFAKADLQGYISQSVGGQTAAQDVATIEARRTFLSQQRKLRITQSADGTQILNSNPFDPTTIEPATLDPGGTPTEFGVVGLPVRRSDFMRVGNTPAKGWGKITGAIIFIQTTTAESVEVALQNMYLTGGYGPDTADATAQPLDYRYTYYDARTGFEGNPSPIMTTTSWVNALRQKVNLTPGAVHSDPAVVERWYRRGGINVDNWYFLGTSSGHGAVFSDTFTDLQSISAGTLAINHDRPVSTIDASGNTVTAQAINALWGPTDGGYLFGCGDPNRPGYLYWSIPGQPAYWPAANSLEVCSPSEQLIMGCLWGGQAYVFSKERLYVLYPNFDGSGAVRANPTACTVGLVTRLGLCATPFGMAYIARDGIRLTSGGDSDLLSENIRQLFHGVSVNGYAPIDFTKTSDMRLVFHDNDLWFLYRDTSNVMQCFVAHLGYKYWRPYSFANALSTVFSDQGAGLQLLMGAKTNGKAYTHSGFTDDGTPISWSCRTGAYNGDSPRQEKQWGDVVVDMDTKGATLTVQTFVNTEATTNPTQAVTGGVGRNRYIFDPFGTVPQKARNLSVELSGVAPTTAQIAIDYVGASVLLQPDVTMLRVTNWDAIGSSSEKYCYGVQLEVDTNSNIVPFVVEYTIQNPLAPNVPSVLTAATLSAQTGARHKMRFTWPAVHGDLWRLRPTGTCQAWEIYRADWLAQSEPPRIAGWDTNWENKGDSYCTGATIECDTFGQNKTVQLMIRDGTGADSATQTFTVNSNGRHLFYLPLNITVPFRGALYRLVSTDGNLGLLYSWNFWTDKEPGELANWNQNYTTAGTMGDKYLKGVILNADTGNATKTVGIEVDGVVATTLSVIHAGRTTLEYSFPQILGRVFRLVPTDSNPGRLYQVQWIFDLEPLALSRWESQETDHMIHGWQSVLWANVTIKSTALVNMAVTIYGNSGAVMDTGGTPYALPSTGNVKQKLYVPFRANKGALYKYVFTSAQPFWLYREESEAMIKPWGGNEPLLKRPFGNDDMDPSRGMGKSALAAAHNGGEADE